MLTATIYLTQLGSNSNTAAGGKFLYENVMAAINSVAPTPVEVMVDFGDIEPTQDFMQGYCDALMQINSVDTLKAVGYHYINYEWAFDMLVDALICIRDRVVQKAMVQ